MASTGCTVVDVPVDSRQVMVSAHSYLHAFTNDLELDRAAVDAGLTTPHHNGRTEGINTRTKKITRDMRGRAGFALLRHRTLLQ